MTSVQFFILNTGTVFSLLLVSLLFRRFKPKTINALYGYRTRRSLRDQISWDLAQTYFSGLMVRGFGILFFIQILSSGITFFTTSYNKSIALFNVFSIIPVLIYTIIKTERALKILQEK